MRRVELNIRFRLELVDGRRRLVRVRTAGQPGNGLEEFVAFLAVLTVDPFYLADPPAVTSEHGYFLFLKVGRAVATVVFTVA